MDEFITQIESELTGYDLETSEFKSILDNLLLRNAKRIRPRLAFLYIMACQGGITEEQTKIISAGEILHTASLIHDDIIDDASLRRGMRTLHSVFDSKFAVLAGDFLASFGMKKIIRLNNTEIISLFHETFEKMCKAEISQYIKRGEIPSMEEYLLKTTGKTASLFASILKGAAILSQSVNPDAAYELGTAFGIAFQIKNDLNAFIECSESDRKNGIYTAPDIFYFKKNDVSFAIEKTNALIDNEIEKMLKIISEVPDSIYKAQLIQLIKESLCTTKK